MVDLQSGAVSHDTKCPQPVSSVWCCRSHHSYLYSALLPPLAPEDVQFLVGRVGLAAGCALSLLGVQPPTQELERSRVHCKR